MRIVAVCVLAALVIGVGIAGAEEAKPVRPEMVTGKVTKVDETSLTVVSKGNDGVEKTTELTLNADTKVMVPTGETEEFTAKDGTKKTRPKTVEGKLTDLKVDQEVRVFYKKDGSVATRVMVMPAKEEKKPEGETK